MTPADTSIHAVTGAYGYSGKYIAQRLLDQGQKVITLTNSLSRANPFGDCIKAFPFHFDQPDRLADQLRGVSVLYNTYRELVRTIGQLIGRPRPILSVPPWFGYTVGWLLGKLVGDVVITRDEIEGLMADLLHVDAPPAGPTRLADWAKAHADTLGRRYTSELARRKDQASAYRSN